MRLAVLGGTGRLGRAIVARAAAAGWDDVQAWTRPGAPSAGAMLTDGIAATPWTDARAVDVVIDVSMPGGLDAAREAVGRAAVVRGVTGADPSFDEAAWAATHAILTTANFSTGVHVLADLVARAARALPDHDVEIVEQHHRNKADAPSGTALLLARAAAAARGQSLDDALYGRHGQTGPRGGAIAIHALRLGDVPGDHEVWFGGDGERLKLGHVATHRDVFAVGALRAARWMLGRPPGRYTMADVLGLAG